MKHIRRNLALLLAVVLVLALSVCAFAAEDYSITVNNTNTAVSINGKIYSAYKIFDATYNGDNVAYTVSTEFSGFSYTNEAGNSFSGDALIAYLGNLDDNSTELDAFAKAALAYVSANHINPAGTAPASNERAVIALSAPGYYLVTGTATAGGQEVTAACSLTTAKPTAEIEPKVDAPSIDKKIIEGENKVAANTANIGDSVNYEITSKVPSMQGYTKYYFVIEDTLSKGLTFNDDLAITIGSKTLAKDTDYTLTVTKNSDGTTSLEIVFIRFIQYKTQADAAITVTYSATLNQDASLDPVAGNPNTVKLTYSNNPNETGTGTGDKPGSEDPVGKTPKSETKTYVTGVKLTKVDSETGKTLTGAKFQIKGTGMKVVLVNKEIYKASDSGTYYMLKNGSYTPDAPIEATKDKYDSTTQKYEKVTVVDKTTVPTDINATGYVNENGVLTFEGLGKGEYEITEIIAPKGYNLLKDPIKLVITADAALEKCTWKVTVGNKTLTAGDDNLYALTVENSAGTELPSTGGIGTTIFYIVGSLLAVGAVILLVTKKRMGKTED